MAAPISDLNVPAFMRRSLNCTKSRLDGGAFDARGKSSRLRRESAQACKPLRFATGNYSDHDKWIGGWEMKGKCSASRNVRVIRLARPGIVESLDLDTHHFSGNFPPAASIEACWSECDTPTREAEWHVIVAATTLRSNQHHHVEVRDSRPFTHVRMNLYPGRALACVHIYGRPRRA